MSGMILNRWNYEKQEYEPYDVPEGWRVTTYSGDLELGINCANCGKEMAFGDGYTSQEIHTQGGFGYAVCEACYEEEYARRLKYRETL